MIRAIQDRIEITDVLYRYASCIDRSDNDGVRSVLADDPQVSPAQPGGTRRNVLGSNGLPRSER